MCKISCKVFNQCFSNWDILCPRTVSQLCEVVMIMAIFLQARGTLNQKKNCMFYLACTVIYNVFMMLFNSKHISLMAFKLGYHNNNGRWPRALVPETALLIARFGGGLALVTWLLAHPHHPSGKSVIAGSEMDTLNSTFLWHFSVTIT